MSSYPGTLDTFNVIGTSNYMDEAGYVLHEHLNTHGSAVTAIETTLGTTAGTSVFKQIGSGEFAVSSNGGTTDNSYISGGTIISSTVQGVGIFSSIISNSTLGTPAITGGTITSTTINSPTIINWDGWITATDTWTYASASTFTIAGVDRTALFPKGTRLKLTQTTAKYAVVVGSAFSTNTTVTIAVNTDYTIANAAITSPMYSYAASPQGYPSYFNYAPTLSGLTIGAGTSTFAYAQVGKTVFVKGRIIFAADTSVSGAIGFTLPVTAADDDGQIWLVRALDNGTNSFVLSAHQATTGRVDLYANNASGTYLSWTATSSTVPFTWAVNDNIMVNIVYEAA